MISKLREHNIFSFMSRTSNITHAIKAMLKLAWKGNHVKDQQQHDSVVTRRLYFDEIELDMGTPSFSASLVRPMRLCVDVVLSRWKSFPVVAGAGDGNVFGCHIPSWRRRRRYMSLRPRVLGESLWSFTGLGGVDASMTVPGSPVSGI